MDVHFRGLSLILSLVFSSAIAAGTVEPIQFAKQYLAHATNLINEKSQSCRQREQEADLSAVKGLAYPSEEVRSAIGYFYMNNYLSCLQPELGLFYQALAAIHALDPEVQALEISRLFSYEQARYYQYKAAYFRLSPERRAKLEAVEELQRPFKLHPAVRAVLE